MDLSVLTLTCFMNSKSILKFVYIFLIIVCSESITFFDCNSIPLVTLHFGMSEDLRGKLLDRYGATFLGRLEHVDKSSITKAKQYIWTVITGIQLR